MSMPLPAKRGVPSHSEEWVPRAPELVIGRASITPLIRGSSLSMPLPAERLSFPLILRNEFSAPPSSVISLAGRASIAPLTIEGYLWACRSLLSGEFPLILRNKFPALQSSWLGLPLPSEWRSAFSFWGMSSPLSRARFGLTLRSEFSALELLIGSWVPLIPRNEFSALQGSPSVELALLPSTRGSPMSMPLPSERPSFSAPQSSVIGRSPCWSSQHCSPQPEGHLWACRSLLSVWVPSHSEEWVVLCSRA